MISVSLPPVFFGSQVMDGEVMEALAMSYWAYYNDRAISARVLQSMQNSWGVLNAGMIPRNAGVYPGAVYVRIGTPGNYRLIVAIEGLFNLAYILANPTAVTGITTTGLSGCVVLLFADSQTSLATAAAANFDLASDLANPRIPVTFCGHSHGAAVAEIWSAKCRQLVPGKVVKCVKFASPRVGTSLWNRRRNPAVKRRNCYTHGDLIGNTPKFSYPLPFQATTTLRSAEWCVFSQDAVTDVVDQGGEGNYYYTFADEVEMAYALTQYPNASTPGNVWWPHQQDVYRAWFCSWAAKRDPELLYRFRYMEFEDDNQWGQLWTPGADFDPAFKVMASPAPAAVAPPTQAIATDAAENVGGGGDDWGPQEDPINVGGGGGEWGMAQGLVLPVIETNRRRQRATRTVQQ